MAPLLPSLELMSLANRIDRLLSPVRSPSPASLGASERSEALRSSLVAGDRTGPVVGALAVVAAFAVAEPAYKPVSALLARAKAGSGHVPRNGFSTGGLPAGGLLRGRPVQPLSGGGKHDGGNQ